jgi:hypothetical protein
MLSWPEHDDRPLRRALPAWLLSFIIHTLALILGVLFVRVAPRGVEEPGRGVGIVLTQASASGEVEYFSDSGDGGSPLAGGAASSEASDAERMAVALPGSEQFPETTGPQLPQGIADLGLPGDDALPGAGGFTSGGKTGASGLAGKGQATLEVFGIEGTGSRFVYVFDRSLSMSGYGGRPLVALKSELLASLQSLGSVHQFQIIFYNEEPRVFNTRPGQSPQMVFATDENKRLAEAFVSGVSADGGTQHLDPLLKALGMSPDVIFFLTDADDPKLTEAELKRIRQRNRGGTIIHCIEYGSGPSQDDNNFLRRLAAQNGGQHTYVDVRRLPAGSKRP